MGYYTLAILAMSVLVFYGYRWREGQRRLAQQADLEARARIFDHDNPFLGAS